MQDVDASTFLTPCVRNRAEGLRQCEGQVEVAVACQDDRS